MSKYCPNCGTPVNNAQNFCIQCGASLANNSSFVKELSINETESKQHNHIPSQFKVHANYDSKFTNDNPSNNFTQDNLYQMGMDIIISSSLLYSAPFMMAGKKIYDQFVSLESVSGDNFSLNYLDNTQLDIFLSNFYKYSNAFIERITQYFADIIRKNTFRYDIKEKTSESISDSIRNESFKKFDEVFSKYSATMEELGVQIASISTIKSAVQGTLVGGGLQLMGTKGKSSGAGMVAGALIGAINAETEKALLRDRLLKTAFDGIIETLDILPSCNEKLMDQFSSYIYGSNIDFNERDKQINRGKEILSDIKYHCSLILDNIRTDYYFWYYSQAKINNFEKGRPTWLISIGSFLISVIIMNNLFSSEDAGLGFIFTLILTLLVTLFYKFVILRNKIIKEKDTILAELKLKKKNYQLIANSLKTLNTYKENNSMEFDLN